MKELLEYLSAVQEAPINTFFFARQRRGERFTQIFREIHYFHLYHSKASKEDNRAA